MNTRDKIINYKRMLEKGRIISEILNVPKKDILQISIVKSSVGIIQVRCKYKLKRIIRYAYPIYDKNFPNPEIYKILEKLV